MTLRPLSWPFVLTSSRVATRCFGVLQNAATNLVNPEASRRAKTMWQATGRLAVLHHRHDDIKALKRLFLRAAEKSGCETVDELVEKVEHEAAETFHAVKQINDLGHALDQAALRVNTALVRG